LRKPLRIAKEIREAVPSADGDAYAYVMTPGR